jgi:Asp-tRNA(Asn)/Glu-tRNA(Gln) amidotransferase A subunit family amidase
VDRDGRLAVSAGSRITTTGWVADTVPSVDADAPEDLPPPQDRRVDRRWLLQRAAWLSSVAAAGHVLSAPPAAAAQPATTVTGDAAAAGIRGGGIGDPTELTIAEALHAFRTGKLTPVALMEAYLARIERFEAVYLAYNDRPDPAEVLALAKALGRSPGRRELLWGTAMAPKDNYYTKDLLTTGNSPIFIDFQPTYDSTCVARLRANRGIVIGKAQMGPLASGRALLPGTDIPTTRNAWTPDDIRYSPSGSSGGTATAVAARLATSGIGTQTGGSITSPGQAQGLTALKPTFGRTSLYGVIPLTYTRDHTGPIARDAKDAAIMLQALAGADPHDPRTVGLPPVPDYITAATPVTRHRRIELRWRTRIGILPGWATPTDPEQASLRAQLLDVLRGVPGCTVADVTLPDGWDELQSISSTTGEGSNWFVPYLRQDVRLFATRLTGFLSGTLRSASTYLKAMMARYELFERTQTQLFSQCDLVLVPNVGQFDLIGHPLCAFPIGFGTDATTGLTVPRGAVLGGAPFSEERILSVICAYQVLTDWHTRRPPDPTVTAEPPAPAPAGGAALMGTMSATLRKVPAWPGSPPAHLPRIDAAAQPPDEN